MRVLHVPSWFPEDATDIAGVFTREHVRCLAPHVEQRVVFPSLRRSAPLVREDGFELIRPRFRHPPGTWLVPYVATVLREARAFRPDLIHGHISRPAGVAVRWASLRLGVPYVMTEQAHNFAALMATHSLNREAARWALRGAAAVTAVGRALALEMANAVQGITPEVVPNTVDLTRFGLRRPGSGEETRLLFLGRLVPQKGLGVLLRALAQAALHSRRFRLLVAGSGSEEASLKRQAAALADRVEFVGYRPPSTVPDLLAAADVFVLPSNVESFGVVLIEALAAGVPVVATACGGPADIVSDEVGRLVPAGDVDALAGALAWMIDNHRSFEPARLRAYANSRWGFPAVAQRFLGIYDRALGARRADG